MTTNDEFLTADSKRGFFSRGLTNIVSSRLPRRFKRLIYISSIMGLLEEVKDPDMEVVEKLNEVFRIAKYPDAYIFPMYIKSIIWKDVSKMPVALTDGRELKISQLMDTELSTRECAIIGEHFAKRAPSWLKYGSVDLMVEDIIKLLKQLKRYHSVPMTA